MSLSDIRNAARSASWDHPDLTDLAVYLAPQGAEYAAPVAVRARRHFRNEALGPSGVADGAERAEQHKKVVLRLSEVSPTNNGLLVFSATQVWVLRSSEPEDYGFVTWKVTALPAAQAAALDWAAINAAAGWA